MTRYVFIGPFVLLMLWGIVTYTGFIDPLLLAAPHDVARRVVLLFVTGKVLPDLGWTVLRWVSGLALGILLGVPIGLLMGASNRIYSSLEIVVDFFRSIPVMATFPIFLVFFGLGERSKIAISAWTTILYVLINTLYGVRHGSAPRRMVAKVFRATSWQTFTKVIFPEALPHVFVGIRLSVSMSLVLVVAAEMLMGTTAGLGKRIFDCALTFNISEMYATVIIAGTLGYLSNRLFCALEGRLIHWVTA